MSCPMASSISFTILCARCLASGLKFLFHIDLAQSFAEIVVHITDATLPSWLELLRSLQGLAVEIKVGVHEIGRQERRIRIDKMPAQISLPARQGFRSGAPCSAS